MTFDETLKQVQDNSKLYLKRSMQLAKDMGVKDYKQVTYGRGSFYFDGLMYHTDDGSLVNPIGSVELELMRIGDSL